MTSHSVRLKRACWLVLGVIMLAISFPLQVLAAVDQTIHSIDVSVALADDGSAQITERWRMTVNEGTEIYKTLELPSGETLFDYTVSMDGQPLTHVDDWDVDGDFEDKQGTYGQNDDELNWGITSYGDHTYELRYTIKPFVMETTSKDQMIFWQFINEGLAVPPQHFTIHISSPQHSLLAKDGYRVWGFGFNGETQFTDGAITAETTKPMREDGKGVLLIKIPAGTFTEPLAMDRSFDDYVEGAFAGSSYNMADYEEGKTVSDGGEMRQSQADERTDKFIGWGLVGLFGTLGLGAIWGLWHWYKQHRARQKYYPTLKKAAKQQAGTYYRDLPMPEVYDGYPFLKDLAVDQLEANYFLVGILELAKDDYIMNERDAHNQSLLFLNSDKQAPRGPVYELWAFLDDAIHAYPKNDGNYITQKQLKKYIKRHYTGLKDYLEEVKRTGSRHLREENLRATRQKVRSADDPDLARANVNIPAPLNHEGLAVRDHWVQFYNYLQDFSLLSEREINEVKLWDQLLIYGAALGIAEEVAKEFQHVMPDHVSDVQLAGNSPTFTFADYYIWSSVMNSSYQAVAVSQISAASSGGFGGGTSFGGGGGSFGGGAGGGAR